MVIKNFKPLIATWYILHGRGVGVALVEVAAGATLSTAQPNVEEFSTMAAADFRMRDFLPLWALDPIDINGVNPEAFQVLPGVGEVIAGRIIALQPFEAVARLAAVDGVTDQDCIDWADVLVFNPQTFADYDRPKALPDAFLGSAVLIDYLAQIRWLLEVGGVEMPGVGVIRTDRTSRSDLIAGVAAFSIGVSGPVDWKLSSGWAQLSEDDLTALMGLVAKHVQACFGAERYVFGLIIGGSGITLAQVDRWFSAAYLARMGAGA